MITKNIRTFIETGARGVINIKMFLCVLLSFGSTVSLASEYLDTSIQSELQNTYSFTRVFESDYLYRKDAIVDEVGPQSSSTITTFHQRLLGGNIAKLPSQQVTDWIPIAGSITFFIPKERTDYPLQKRVGDNFVQSRLVRSQIHSQTGRHLLTTNFSTEAQQIDTLYNNAYALSQKSGFSKKFGERLNDEDIAPHGLDVIWPELRTISGEEVLVPVVHLAGDYSVVGHEVSFSGEQATFKSVNIVSGSITMRRNAMLATAANLVVNEGAKLLADGNLNMNIGGTLLNTGTLSASDAINITAGNYYQKTLVHRFQTHYGFNERLGLVASINATNGITINSMSDITFQGAEAQAGSSIALTAAGDIRIGTVTLSREGSYAYANSSYYTSALQHVQSSLSAGDNIDLMAGGLIEVNASTLHADEGHINLLAGLGITIIDEQNQEQMVAHREYYNLTEDESAYATIAMRSVLDSGKGVRIHSAMGDITLRAADITSEEGTSVLASDGSINMLMTVENDHYSYSSIEEKLFTITNKSRGHNHETAIPNTIIGGFAAEALYGVKVQYEGKDGLTFDEQMNAFGDMEGLEWIAELRNNPDIDIDWEKIETAYEDWDESNTSLSAAAMIIIMIIVSVCTAGAGAALAATMTSSAIAAGGTTAAVLNAGFTAMMSTAAAASANATVNGGTPVEIFESGYEAVLSEDGARSMATAMVTAGAMSAINSEFFTTSEATNFNQPVYSDAGVFTGYTPTLYGQAVQAVTSAAVQSGVRVLSNGGNFDDFEDEFIPLLVTNGVNIIGANVTEQILSADLSGAAELIALTATQCLVGAASGDADEGNVDGGCAAGATASLISQLVDYVSSSDREELTLKQAEVAGWLEANISSDSLLNSDFKGLLDSGMIPPESLYYVNEFQDTTAELARLTELQVDTSRLIAALGVLVAGGSDVEVEIASGAAVVVGQGQENLSQNNVRNASFIYSLLAEQERLRVLATSRWSIESIENQDILDGIEFPADATISGAALSFLYNIKLLEDGELYISLPERLDGEGIDLGEEGYIDFANLRQVSFSEGVGEALDQFEYDLNNLINDPNITNADELRWWMEYLRVKYEEVQVITDSLEIYAGGGLVTRFGVRATDNVAGGVSGRVSDAAEYMARSRSASELVQQLDGLENAVKAVLQSELVKNRNFFKGIKSNPDLIDHWKNLYDNGIAESIRTNLDALNAVKQAELNGLDALDSLEDAFQVVNKERPSWNEIKALFKRGNDFNKKARDEEWYEFYEVHLENGKRLDSYDPDLGEIISRKATDFNVIQLPTFEKYLREFDLKYASGTVIRSDKYRFELDGTELWGSKILEVPDVNQYSYRLQEFLEMANQYNVVIRFRPE